MSEQRYRPFSSGTQCADWVDRNCIQCAKGCKEGESPTCPIDVALNDSFWGDGQVSEDIARRMGFLDHNPPAREHFSYTWPCPEFVPIEVLKP